MDANELRRRFEAEIEAADLHISDQESEKLYTLWSDYLPHRDALRHALIPVEEEPKFIEKPTATRGAP